MLYSAFHVTGCLHLKPTPSICRLLSLHSYLTKVLLTLLASVLPSGINTITLCHRPIAANLDNLIQVPPTCNLLYTPCCTPINFGLLNIRSLNNKSCVLWLYFFNNVDFLIIPETWLSQGHCNTLIESAPLILLIYILPGCQAGEGRLAVIYKRTF